MVTLNKPKLNEERGTQCRKTEIFKPDKIKQSGTQQQNSSPFRVRHRYSIINYTDNTASEQRINKERINNPLYVTAVYIPQDGKVDSALGYLVLNIRRDGSVHLIISHLHQRTSIESELPEELKH